MDRKEWEFRLANHCGPVFKGAAAANFVTLRQADLADINKIITGSSVSFLPLWEERGSVAALFYRHSFLAALLKKDAVNLFLGQMGYRSMVSDHALSIFQERYQKFRMREAVFPHELGLLLGFPFEDVKDYILHEGKDYLMSGYWKVYHNLPYARMRFLEYDNARISCIGNILEDVSWKDIIDN